MLAIGYTFTGENDQQFHVGAGRIKDFVNVREITSFGPTDDLVVQADGDELEVIRAQFSNIPMTNNRVVRWRGDIAVFIVNNLKL